MVGFYAAITANYAAIFTQIFSKKCDFSQPNLMWILHSVDNPFWNCRIGNQSALIGLNLWHPWIIRFWRSRLFKHKQIWDQLPIFFRDPQMFGFHYVVEAFQDLCILPHVPLWQRPKKILQWGVHLHLQGSYGDTTIQVKWFLRSFSTQSFPKHVRYIIVRPGFNVCPPLQRH